MVVSEASRVPTRGPSVAGPALAPIGNRGIPVEQAFKDEFRRQELADFLKSRRKRLKAETSGLHERRRRLTSGLRREEVAERAGLGTTWYTWLEQARDIHPSEVTLHRIARALQLDKAEKRYLFDLALERAPRTIRDDVPTPALLATVNGLGTPAIVVGQWWDIIAYNEAANALLDLDYAPTRNRLRNTFTPQVRAFHPDWASFARESVAQFRARNGAMLAHPAVVTLVSELRQRSEHFRAFWAAQEVSSEMNSGHFTFDNPFVGRLTFQFEHFQVMESPSLTLLTQVCHGAETRRRFDELLRQLRHGERSAAHNLWTAVTPRRYARAG
jgi:transcriptional regulator with XRE-family HTH domain